MTIKEGECIVHRRWIIWIASVVVGALIGTVGSIVFARITDTELSIVDAMDKIGASAYEHPDGVTFYFDDSITERNRELVRLAVDIARPLFEENGFTLDANIYVTGDKDSFVETYRVLFEKTAEEAANDFTRFLGVARVHYANVLLNHGIYGASQEADVSIDEVSDVIIVRTTVHELYHVLQRKLSEGWGESSGDLFDELSADIAARRAIVSAFCAPYYEIVDNVSREALAETCDPEFVQEELVDLAVISFLDTKENLFMVEMYVLGEFGIGAFDDYYRTFPEIAEEFYDFDAFEEEAAGIISERLFGFSDLESALERASEYLEEHGDAIFERLREKY